MAGEQTANEHQPPEMLQILRIVLVFLAIFAGSAEAYNGCRKCEGTLNLVFKSYTSLKDVETYVTSTLGQCATGKQYDLVKMTEANCILVGFEYSCKTWNFAVKAWRFCGNGSKAILKQNNVCIGNICTTQDQLDMHCIQSVACAGRCHCDTCGC